MEFIAHFFVFQIYLFMILSISGIPFNILTVIMTVMIYERKKKLLWLSALPWTINFIIVSIPALSRESFSIPSLKDIIDVLAIITAFAVQFGIYISATIATMIIIDKIKRRKSKTNDKRSFELK